MPNPLYRKCMISSKERTWTKHWRFRLWVTSSNKSFDQYQTDSTNRLFGTCVKKKLKKTIEEKKEQEAKLFWSQELPLNKHKSNFFTIYWWNILMDTSQIVKNIRNYFRVPSSPFSSSASEPVTSFPLDCSTSSPMANPINSKRLLHDQILQPMPRLPLIPLSFRALRYLTHNI